MVKSTHFELELHFPVFPDPMQNALEKFGNAVPRSAEALAARSDSFRACGPEDKARPPTFLGHIPSGKLT